MKLLISPTSPYVRKTRVLMREKGLLDRIEEISLNPHQDPAELLAQNRLGKIPVLVRDDGDAFYDSPVICEYLDCLTDAPRLIPASGEARWAILRAQALADGILDLTVAIVMERARPEAEQSRKSMARWREKIERSVGGMSETLSAIPANGFDLGRIACAVTLGYLDFRLPEYDWRGAQPELIDWYANVAARKSMEETAPPKG